MRIQLITTFTEYIWRCGAMNKRAKVWIFRLVFIIFLHRQQPVAHLLKDHSWWRVHFLWSVLVSIGTNAQLPISIVAPWEQFSTLREGQGWGLSAGHWCTVNTICKRIILWHCDYICERLLDFIIEQYWPSSPQTRLGDIWLPALSEAPTCP